MATPIVVCGAAGRMGRLLVQLIAVDSGTTLAAAVEAPGHAALGRDAGEVAGIEPLGVRVAATYAPAPASVTLDFSAPGAALSHLEAAAAAGAAIVLGTTGLSPAERTRAEALGRRTRTVIAPNMSVGVAVLERLIATATTALGPAFDVEIAEVHHRLKRDAPSGTALRLGEVVAAAQGTPLAGRARFGREGEPGPRSDAEIGIVGLRGGDAVGDHTVYFLGAGERLELTHRAQSRECLARGALRAALWLAAQPVGLYTMRDVLGL
ncbi:MAG: 4-hydroxy-tetrahydrodipicolinate reductase [Deltaproteobacteria bacterium]|nr:4-hydroxy-tetrahydrodipicolinate reductase [Deltaproteobacteria bacterium]